MTERVSPCSRDDLERSSAPDRDLTSAADQHGVEPRDEPARGVDVASALTPAGVMALQRVAGNAAVARLLGRRRSEGRRLARFQQDLPDLGAGSVMSVSAMVKVWRPGESEHNRWFPPSGDTTVSIPANGQTVVQIYVSLHCRAATAAGDVWQSGTATWDVTADQYGGLTIRPHGGPAGSRSLMPPSWNGSGVVPLVLRELTPWPQSAEDGTQAAVERRVSLSAVMSRGAVQTSQAPDTTQVTATGGGRGGSSESVTEHGVTGQSTQEVSGSGSVAHTHADGPTVVVTRPDVPFQFPFTLSLWVPNAQERPAVVNRPPKPPTRSQHLHLPVSELRFRGPDGRLRFGGDRAVVPEHDVLAGELDALNAWLRRLEGGPGWQSNLWAAIRGGMITFQVRGHASRDGSPLANDRYAASRAQWVAQRLDAMFGGLDVAPHPEHRGQADAGHAAHAPDDHSVEIWIDANEAVRGIDRWIGDPARLQQVPPGASAPP